MAMRPTWKGSISFGLVNIPVSLYLATQSERISFHMLHAKDHGRVRYKRVCEIDGEEVPWGETIKGYEYEKGAYLPIENEDLESIDIGIAHTIDIRQFVEAAAIEPAFYDRPYFLEPARGGERAYALLREALIQSGKVGIARIVFRDRESLASVRPRGDGLALETLRFAAELRDDSSLRHPSGESARISAQQLELAQLLIDRLSGPWDPAAYQDRYDEAVERMIERKLEGRPAPEAPARAPPGQVIDLAKILRRSLEKEGQGAAADGGQGGERRTGPKPLGEARAGPSRESRKGVRAASPKRSIGARRGENPEGKGKKASKPR